MMSAAALLASSSQPTDLDINGGQTPSPCGTLPRIRAAIKRAAMRMPKLDLVESTK